MSTFGIANDETLVTAIEQCRKRMAYIAPGVTKPVAEAIGRLYSRPTPPQVTIILDADAEVYRLGYGTEDGITRLRELVEQYQIVLRSQPGLRMGVLASDDELLVYAPTPLLVEAGTQSEQKPNAIRLGSSPMASILDAAGAEGAPSSGLARDSEIGRDALSAEKMNGTLQDLQSNPPKAFNIARIERVFSSKLQYVELEITGYKLSTRRVSIPNDLLIGEDRNLEKRLKNTYSLLQEPLAVEIGPVDAKKREIKKDHDGNTGKESYSEQTVQVDRKRLEDNYLTNIPGYGWLIKRSDRSKFDAKIKQMEDKLGQYQKRVKEEIDDRVEKSTNALAAQLLEKLEGKLPGRLGKTLLSAKPTYNEMLAVVVEDLRKSFDKVTTALDPKVRVQYKDITYETIKEDKFRELVAKAYWQPGGPDATLERLFEEYDAARESDEP